MAPCDLAWISKRWPQVGSKSVVELDMLAERACQKCSYPRTISALMSVSLGSSSLLAGKASSWPLIELLPALNGIERVGGATHAASRRGRPLSQNSKLPVIAASKLLKSWAMPPVSLPIASIFCDCRSCSSAASLAVRSRTNTLNI